MVTPDEIRDRLDAIGRSLDRHPPALALLGLGSVGVETDRIDEWSDLDFFVVVERGAKSAFVDDLGWLSAAAPLVWSHRNTVDGHKALMHDGLLCEFAVFERDELDRIAYAPGRVVWRRAGFDAEIVVPAVPLPQPSRVDAAVLVDEALSNLYVGLLRWHRGERLAAMRMIQVFAVDRLLELIERTPAVPGVTTDPFDLERRAEARHPEWSPVLAGCAQGIDRTPESALAMLGALARFADLAPEMTSRIRALT